MVSCQLIGRMGNQQLQIACCIAYALRHGLEYHIPDHTLDDNQWTPRFTHLTNPNWNPSIEHISLKETKYTYEEPPFKQGWRSDKINIIIEGYRQSEKYFKDYLPEVRKAFGFDYTIKKHGWCAVHIRRGDYLKLQDKHPPVTKEYILAAISIMKQRGINSFIFYSDDPEWVKTFVPYLSFTSKTQVAVSVDNTEKEDFKSMLECEHFITANSSYSLVASILSESPNKIIICPSRWYGESMPHITTDLYPENSIVI